MPDLRLIGNTIERHPGGFFLNIFDHRPQTLDLMEEHGLQGGGPTWLGLLTAALEMESPVTLEQIDLDDESDLLLVTAPDRPPLEIVQTYAALLMSDPGFLLQCVSHGQDGGYME